MSVGPYPQTDKHISEYTHQYTPRKIQHIILNLQSHTYRLVAQTRQTWSSSCIRGLSENEDPYSLIATTLEASHALYNLNTCTIYSSMLKHTRVTVEIHLLEGPKLSDLVLAVFLLFGACCVTHLSNTRIRGSMSKSTNYLSWMKLQVPLD